MQLLTATIANGGDIQGVVNMMTQQTAQKALAAAVLEQLLKRKVSRLHEDDATTLASQPEVGAVKQSFFFYSSPHTCVICTQLRSCGDATSNEAYSIGAL